MRWCLWRIRIRRNGGDWRRSATGRRRQSTTRQFEGSGFRVQGMPTLQVKVVPGASRNRVVGMLGDALKVQVAAAPEKGKANEAVRAVLAEFFGVKIGQVELISGQTRPRK